MPHFGTNPGHLEGVALANKCGLRRPSLKEGTAATVTTTVLYCALTRMAECWPQPQKAATTHCEAAPLFILLGPNGEARPVGSLLTMTAAPRECHTQATKKARNLARICGCALPH
jgi:hypothetical protein